MTREEAIKKGFLENKKIILKPSPRKGKMVKDNDKGHIAYFRMDGTSTFFSLPRNKRGDLIKIFNTDEEREYFESTLGLDLNESKPENYFEKFFVKVSKDDVLMLKGEEYDLSDPMDNLRAKILKVQPSIAPSWEDRLESNKYHWALVDESELQKEAEDEFDSQQALWMHIGSISNDIPKLRTNLIVYLSTIGSRIKIPIDVKKRELMIEINKLAADKKGREQFLDISNDTLFKVKAFVLQCLDAGGITKEGNNVYMFTGDDITYTFNDIAKKLYELKEEQDDIYFRLSEQVEKNK